MQISAGINRREVRGRATHLRSFLIEEAIARLLCMGGKVSSGFCKSAEKFERLSVPPSSS